MNVGAAVVAVGCVLVVAMTTWCVLRVRHWRGIAEQAIAEQASASGYGRCHAIDLRVGDCCFVWAYVLEHGEWMHGAVAKIEHDTLDTDEVQLVRLVLAEGASFTAKPFAPAWVLPSP